jgi:hypothetical protein
LYESNDHFYDGNERIVESITCTSFGWVHAAVATVEHNVSPKAAWRAWPWGICEDMSTITTHNGITIVKLQDACSWPNEYRRLFISGNRLDKQRIGCLAPSFFGPITISPTKDVKKPRRLYWYQSLHDGRWTSCL